MLSVNYVSVKLGGNNRKDKELLLHITAWMNSHKEVIRKRRRREGGEGRREGERKRLTSKVQNLL